jgi:hypothetical protein
VKNVAFILSQSTPGASHCCGMAILQQHTQMQQGLCAAISAERGGERCLALPWLWNRQSPARPAIRSTEKSGAAITHLLNIVEPTVEAPRSHIEPRKLVL